MFSLSTHSAIDEIPAADWNRLAGTDAPFLRHEFLLALERHGCVGPAVGLGPAAPGPARRAGRPGRGGPLLPQVQLLRGVRLRLGLGGRLCPRRAALLPQAGGGLALHPRHRGAHPDRGRPAPRGLLPPPCSAGAVDLAERLGVSSLHWLFTAEDETAWAQQQGLMRRLGCQFHWHNAGYGSFDDFLGAFSAPKRKNVKRERRRVAEAGIRFRRLLGSEVSAAEWELFHRLYCDTFDKRGGYPTLTLPFFREIGQTMGEQMLLVLAYQGHGRLVAAAFNLLGSRTLYGRHWGCFADFHSLHFEACYYQGLDYCIRRGLERFEPGAQGEHKVSRGFLPTPTWSAHWIGDSGFRNGIGRFLRLETESMQDYIADMTARSPFRTQGSGPDAT